MVRSLQSQPCSLYICYFPTVPGFWSLQWAFFLDLIEPQFGSDQTLSLFDWPFFSLGLLATFSWPYLACYFIYEKQQGLRNTLNTFTSVQGIEGRLLRPWTACSLAAVFGNACVLGELMPGQDPLPSLGSFAWRTLALLLLLWLHNFYFLLWFLILPSIDSIFWICDFFVCELFKSPL